MKQVHFASSPGKHVDWIIDFNGSSVASSDGRLIHFDEIYQNYAEQWKHIFVDWLGKLNIDFASKDWWAYTSTAKNMLSSPLGEVVFKALAASVAIQKVSGGYVQVVGATPNQIKTLADYCYKQGIRVCRIGSLFRKPQPKFLLARLIWSAFRVFALHVVRCRQDAPSAKICLLTYVDKGFRDGHDGFFGSLASMLADTCGEMPLHLAIVQAPLRKMLPKLSATKEYRYWPLYNELKVRDIGLAFVDTFRAIFRVRHFCRSAGSFEGVELSYLLSEAFHWDLGAGGYFYNQLTFYAAKRFSARSLPSRIIYPFEMKSLEKMMILGVRAGSPKTRLVGYQHSSITPRHTTFLLAHGEHEVTPLPDYVVTVGDVTRSFLERYGGYPPGLFRTGGALRQVKPTVLSIRSNSNAPLRLLLALSSSRKELIEAIIMLCALKDLRADVEISVRSHPEFPLSLLPKKLAKAIDGKFQDVSTDSLADSLDWCDALIYVSSTVALEAMLLGRPVICLRLSDPINPDPVLFDPPHRYKVSSVLEINSVCDDLHAINRGNVDACVVTSNYANSYLCPFTRESLDAFLTE